MDCKQIDGLLPLYAGRDLDEKRTRLVGEHIQTCSGCARVADEYRATVELTQHFAPPVFNENAYATVRRRVLRQIEDEPSAPLLPQMFGSWFRPRTAWAIAGVLIITFAFVALYLVGNRAADVQPVADNHPILIKQPGSMATPRTTAPLSPPGPVKPANEKRRRIHNSVNRSPLVVANATKSSRADNSPKLRDPEATSNLPAVDAVTDESPLRVEMQTKDPNIRIIWFTQPNTKPALPNAKGI